MDDVPSGYASWNAVRFVSSVYLHRCRPKIPLRCYRTGYLDFFIFQVILLENSFTVPFNWKVVTKLYRGTLLVIIHIFFIGINVYGWSSSGVNHVLIFEIDPRNHLTHQDLLEVSIIRYF